MTKCDVSVVGLYILDILGRAMDKMPPPGQADIVEEIRLTVAGTAGGTAVDCAKLGLATCAIGALGDDEKAGFMCATMAEHGIDIAGMARLAGVSTSTSMLPILPSGQRSAWFVPGASACFALDAETIGAALAGRIVHLGGTGLLGDFDGAPSRDLLEQAKAAGCITTHDLIIARPETADQVDPLMPFVDYFIPSIDETRIMTGCESSRDNADYYLDRGAGCCAITLGAEGSYIAARDGRRFHVPPIRDIEIVDTTGCGDAYSAGFIAGLARDLDLEGCAYLATAAASLVATGLGSDAGIVSFEATQRLAEAHHRAHPPR